MNWLDLVTAVAIAQYIWFGVLVGQARGRYGVHAPAVTGHETFERYYRVQMNTLELLVPLVPAMYLAARYWSPVWVAAAGAVYVVGRFIYLRAYVADPKTRALGYSLSALPVLGLLVAVVAGVFMAA
ncbi:MAPEG family protein [Rhodoferax mekongensis]|uniref:MAPEG family protein n=1 Tax=Rhodoferax mekongensis TaxID=3068341 RepID=A0ABZ0AY67_9BURK|nr:MAPEG family protein [Rhodoferax sp. TBRC 17307]WNO04250.1 MAPEG family protein [Rhodoferax sp. TBRC 17307]